MRNRGGKKMQAMSSKYGQSAKHTEIKASDRFDVRIKIARQVTHNVADLNDKLYRSLMREVMKDIYGKRKK